MRIDLRGVAFWIGAHYVESGQIASPSCWLVAAARTGWT
jgi:hypothetical protein